MRPQLTGKAVPRSNLEVKKHELDMKKSAKVDAFKNTFQPLSRQYELPEGEKNEVLKKLNRTPMLSPKQKSQNEGVSSLHWLRESSVNKLHGGR